MNKTVLKQSQVRFVSDTHQYFLGDKELFGITSTLIKRAYPDTYKKPDNYTEEQWAEILNNAAAKGSNMHETIELYEDLGVESDSPELQSYIRIKKENNLTALASEYVVSDEEHYATAIDMVAMNAEGEIVLIDFKRTYNLHIDNVTLQQSICKRWFEKLNPGLKVANIYVLWMREDKSRFEKLTPWCDDQLDMLINADINDEEFDVTKTYGNLPAKVAAVQDYLFELEEEVKAKTEELKNIKEGLCQLMLQNNIKSFKTDRVQMTVSVAKPRETFDSKKFKEDHPELYDKYIKVGADGKPSIRITYKNGD